ncbi:cysteine-rich receptor-like protein kinase 13 isoform X2 [Arabidopsis lyrata subsp. lyrata]|uniref:cysteine-rich receptor-like protein kinase 13 isoform X2 n=1 Tax=Arabidopsis lyrata subsp. lyrata TaxID=81972 RepID=UPI000A29A72D|nr:cysteine-rich receptor-like protein kinase 13 isoform X2 [Arabidopsis lyrata subsp. lyrata]|eukprot:XP_020873350.1 cysteine-rich receptor-like protein kinase 13 isoform X2 [Arabidopsis lyrata subsp. lyrata]
MKQRSFLSILCFVLLTFGVASVSAQTCIQNRKYFIPNGTYDSNRLLLLSTLPNNTASQDGFYYGSIGEEQDRVYALGMCIPRSTPSDCSNCIKGAAGWLIQDCVNQTDAYYWALDPTLCLVRYSNISFSGSAAFWETTPQYLVLNTATIASDLTEFKTIWEDLTSRMITAASAARRTPSSSDNHYRVDFANLTKFQNIYALMQCTPDISSDECNSCLQQGVLEYQSCCGNNTGGYVMRPICFFRWQLFTFSKAFDNITLATPPSPPLSPPPLQRPVVASQPPSAKDRPKTTDNSKSMQSYDLFKDSAGRGNISMKTIVAIVVVVLVIVIILALLACRFARKGKPYQEVELNQTGITTVRSLQYKFKTIKSATKKFSDKIGQGGFGSVFKGMLPDGKEIAVKRLSKSSEQGEKEFKNEVVVVAKLQHRNLVRLLGFSVKGEEKILVYEFVPNKSLDCFLSDPIKQRELDWTKRYMIIGGIAKGIQYLHHGSRIKIIHRDLKAENILLDGDMNPKISDFGMARIFGMDQTRANTRRIVGTEGYMPPEYRIDGQFSMKSDVYSYGVLVLEIICGKKNRNFCPPAPNLAWRLWRDGAPLELVDPIISENCPTEEVIRCIHIALLCVQENPTDRPDISIIMSMLTSNSVILPVPEPPGFFISNTQYQSTRRSNSQTINDET